MMEGKAERSSAIPATNQQSAFCFYCAAAHHSYKYPIPYSFSVYILYFTVYTVAAESTTPLLRRGPPSRGILSLSPASPPVFILLFQRCPFGFCSDDDSALEVAVFSTYVTAGIYFMSFPHQQAPTTEWHRPAFLFLRPN
jgi:hypothetical protein